MVRFGAGLLALSVAMATPAWASDKQDFVGCDGRAHPGRQDDGMRGEPAKPSWSFSGARFGANVIATCTRALASPRLLPTQTVRRAHLLRARAVAYLQSGDHAKALADLDLAVAAAPERAADRFYRRSMGVSIDLLRAVALAQAGSPQLARPLALSAMAARPYSVQVQRLGAEILHATGPGEGNSALWSNAFRLDPGIANSALLREAEAGNYSGVLAMRRHAEVTWPTKPLGSSLSLFLPIGDNMSFLSAVIISLHTAYARAATGDPAGARADLAEVRAKAAAALVPAPGASTTASDLTATVKNVIDSRAKQVEARVAVAEGRPSDAIAVLVGSAMPKDSSTVELLKALKAIVPAKDAALVPDIAAFQETAGKSRRDGLTRLVSTAMIAPETPRAVIDYDKARPNILAAVVGASLSLGTSLLGGIDRTDGFRSTNNADGTVKVEFIGNTPSAALVQEMTLLRAAELARAAGKPGFVIVDRKDYTRTLRTTRGGMEISSQPTGFKTEYVIRFVDKAGADDRALDAVAIIDSLGPLYYEDKASKA